ncbi:M1 family metallopeptidase [Thiolinea disciformis]|uniref:M1 family metallopeptidase n=1 Tax=Thiolinea disciformis TaxID=125614 RepID=UPI00036B1F3C|nr:M1 family aminopeptidase [Thiolinea disciformis]
MDRMRQGFRYWLWLLCGLLYAFPVLATDKDTDLIIHHQLQVTPDLSLGSVSIKDNIAFNVPPHQTLEVSLNKKFRLTSKQTSRIQGDRRLIAVAPNQSITLEYEGQFTSTPDCDWLQQICVMLSERGLYLDPNLAWYAQLPNARHTFTLAVDLPPNWLSITQGELQGKTWIEQHPQDAIYLVAGAFTFYQAGAAQVYLLNNNETLANQYLKATQEYLSFYTNLLGEYPYKKFATVESFWETGWGMPSFTLLGSKVMRLPFILETSLPHEILHNWWGNGVYTDASQANWSEGLTAYLSDYYLKELKGLGADYRRDALQQYAAFTQAGHDLPLNAFRSRHDNATQAVGYSKALMLFHSLRLQIGDASFFTALKQFYQNYRFRAASFDDLQKMFERVSQQDLKGLFEQGLNRTGAPQLSLKQASLKLVGTQVQLGLSLKQQGDKPWQMRVPIVASFADGQQNTQWFPVYQSEQTLSLLYEKLPVAVAVDPYFEVLRLPNAREVPAALNVLFNDEPKYFVLQRKLTTGMEFAWEEWAEQLAKNNPQSRIQYDDEPLPESGIMVLLGGDNEALTRLLMRANQPFKLNDTAFTLNSETYMCGLHSLGLALTAGQQPVILLDAPTPEALQVLARKLPHYGKYSYAIFNSLSGDNVAKGQWNVTDSPLTLTLPTLEKLNSLRPIP